ncbi:MAG TPA: sodium:solute symporter [Gaiellaceae bacterium]|nr:sodium:solute symporter [Gaiellaceae bacterium]
MLASVEWGALSVFIVIGGLVTVTGIVAARWRRAKLDNLEEWGLAGRRFGTVVTWFLVGGDLYTAYTFVAVPALVFGKGGIGLFAIPYTIVVYPIVLLTMPRLWQVARNRGYVTGSDFVRDRFDSRFLALMVALTGIVATMPYIALQMYGIEVVLAQMGVPVDASLWVAFAILAVFTYVSGLRAPALLALVKDAIIWVTVLVCVIYIPIRLGGYGTIFRKLPAGTATLPGTSSAAYASLFFGSALALFLYPHALTGVFSAQSQKVVKRNAALLPAYSFLLGLIALLGFMAIVAGVKPSAKFGGNVAVPALIDKMFPSGFAGFAFAAIAVGALVPASVMSIAAANLFSRNVWRDFIRRHAEPREEALVSRVVSLLVKVGALVFILYLPTTDVINFQLAGGVWILQTLPAVLFSLYTRWLNRWAVLAGWAVGMGWGTYMLAKIHFAGSAYDLGGLGSHWTWYIGLYAVLANVVVVAVGTALAYLLGWRPRTTIAEAEYEEQLTSRPPTEPLDLDPQTAEGV